MFIVVYRTRIPYTHRESHLEVSAAPHRYTLGRPTAHVPQKNAQLLWSTKAQVHGNRCTRNNATVITHLKIS